MEHTVAVLDVFVPGRPKGEPRPRAFAKDGKVWAYKHGTAESWKTDIAAAVQDRRLEAPAEGPIRVDLTFYMPRPKSHYRTGKYAGELKPSAPAFHTGKPDRDNLDKAVLDALTILRFWQDDSQVCSGRIVKRYEADQGPGCLIKITQLESSCPLDGGVAA